MSDTTITPEERRLLRSGGYGDHERLRLLDALEQAEGENARLAKMVDFMAQQMADVYSTDEDGRYVLTCPNSELRAVDHDCDKVACWQCWAEAARKAVAGEGKA